MNVKPHAGPALPGWYGKLPSLGDFAHRRLSPRFIAWWDEWLQTCLAALHIEAHDDDLPMPIEPLRFWLAPRLCDEQAWCGVIVASVDRVGRRFPLTLTTVTRDTVARGDGGESVWFDRAEASAQQAIASRLSVEAFEMALASLPALDWAPASGSARGDGGDGGGDATGSLWWSRGARMAPRAFTALPPVDACVALFGARVR